MTYHIVYKNFGFERDEDLIAMCHGCHEEFHQRYGVSHNMRDDTYEFIQDKQEELEFEFVKEF